MQVFYQPLIAEGENKLADGEIRHAIKVMRLKKGDAITVTDGKGKFYHGVITEISKSDCHFSIKGSNVMPGRSHSIHICVAPTKNTDRIEWFVEKATEMGVEQISFIHCKNAERKKVNIDRITRKAVSAMKQSGQAWLPTINPIKPFDQCLQHNGFKYIAHVDPGNLSYLKDAPSKKDYMVLIGPEGDFTIQEIRLALNKGFEKVNLGGNTLRTETAALIACHTLNLINQ